ncbi:hypothetical protein [Nafulsella turpanensis]|uniref:hypothetical protein n=1 Tax=Nafulsella turpanensis TaxID=1265690 RepID=UPI00034DD70F|nr:hypothetical protein [Nafulsella turpanensis]
MIHTDHIDPSLRYEALARSAFNNCSKGGDPFGYALQEEYDNFFVEAPNLRGKRALSTVLIKLIIDNSGTDFAERLIGLEESVWNSETQDDIIHIIDKGIEVLKMIKEDSSKH